MLPEAVLAVSYGVDHPYSSTAPAYPTECGTQTVQQRPPCVDLNTPPAYRSCAVRLQQAEATWAERLSAAQASAAAQLEQSQQRHSLELAKAAEAAALQAAEAEARCGL